MAVALLTRSYIGLAKYPVLYDSVSLDSNTACPIATSIVHSKLDYCNSLYYNLPKSQITRLQQIENYLARVVVKTPKCCHITPILHCLHWLKITIQTPLAHL